jgi:prepilin-type N-terminal cleavage/methylation domain-containing protein
MRRGFTLIEILVSVILISIVILGIAKIRNQNISVAKYISQRTQSELSNTLFLDKENEKFNKSKKDAATLLHSLGIKKFKTKSVLKGIKREIIISQPIPINELPLPLRLKSFVLRGEFSAKYYRLF